MLIKLIRYNYGDLLLPAGVLGGFFLLNHLVTAGVMLFLKPDTSIMISSIALPAIAGILILITSLSHVILSFVHTLRFSQTRWRALRLNAGVIVFETLFTMGLAAALAWLEGLFAPALWMKLSGAKIIQFGIVPVPEPDAGASALATFASTLSIESFDMVWWVFFAIALGGMVMGIICGAVLQRFGGRGGWIIWGIFMVVFLSPQLLPSSVLQNMDIQQMLPALCILLVVGILWSIWSLGRAVIKA